MMTADDMRTSLLRWFERFRYESSRPGVGMRPLPSHAVREIARRSDELLALLDGEPVGYINEHGIGVLKERGAVWLYAKNAPGSNEIPVYLAPHVEREAMRDHEAMEKLRALGFVWAFYPPSQGGKTCTLVGDVGSMAIMDATADPADAILKEGADDGPE